MAPRRIVDQLNEATDPEDERDDTRVEAAADDDVDAGDDPEPEDEEPEQDDQQDDQQDDETPAGDEDEEPLVRHARRAREPQPRGDRQFGELRRRARELEIENARLAAAARGNQQNFEETPEVRRARLAAMTPEERTEFRLDEMERNRQQERQMDRFTAADARDRDLYRERARTNKTYAKYEDLVEHRLQLLRAQGQNVTRESILKFMIGERVLDNRTSPRTKQQRQEAQRRVGNERTILPRGKGERGSRSGSKSADLEKRLENVPI